MSLTCIIIDDEQPARALIQEYVKHVPGLEPIGEFKSPLEVISFFAHKKVDIIFLDIQMPGITGLEFIKTLNYKPEIILTTAYSEYALEGYELDVADYLLKPIAFDRFLKAINKVFSKHTSGNPIPPENDQPPYILIKSDGQTHKIILAEILFIEGLREYVSIQLQHKKLITLESLKNLETKLPTNFLRVHKSFIINKKKVTSHSSHDLTIGDKKIPIGMSYRDSIIDQLF